MPTRHLRAPTAAIDGRRLLAEAVGFGRALRAVGLAWTSARRSTSPGRSRSWTSATASRCAPPARRCSCAGATTASRTTACSTSSGAGAAGRLPTTRIEGARRTRDREDGDAERRGRGGRATGDGRTMTELATMGIQVATDVEDGGEVDGTTISPDA